jgi:hypothetical protein
MLRITLWTIDNQRVNDIEVPELQEIPGAIIWGDRVFVRTLLGSYVEVFAYTVPTIGPT